MEEHAHNPVAGRLELPSDYVAGLLEATASLQLRAAESLVVEAARRFDAQTLLTEIFGPVLRAAGERWEQGQFTVLQEHLLSSAVRWQLLHALERWSGRPDGPAVAFTTLSGERHELGALMLAVVAARRGAQAIYLGPDLPVSELAELCRALPVAVVAISLVTRVEVVDAPAQLHELRSVLPDSVRIWVGGAASTALATADLPEGLRVLPDIAAFEQALAPLVAAKGTTL